MSKLCLIISFILAFSTGLELKAKYPVTQQVRDIVDRKKAIVGLSVINTDWKNGISLNANKRFPMQSVFKFHIALAALSEIDKGNLDFNKKILITKRQLNQQTWSPIRDKYPGGITLTIKDLLEYMLISSDNIACDIVLDLLNGPHFVESYFKGKGFKDLSIKFTEEQMHKDTQLQFDNWTTPLEMSKILYEYYYNTRKLLSKESHNFLWSTLKKVVTGQNQIKGKLPKGIVVAHKTGYSGINKNNIINAVNDIGIIFLSPSKPIFISVFITDSKESLKDSQEIIANIAKIVWDNAVIAK